jgi:O-antigen/teichoic acid export membrane protein
VSIFLLAHPVAALFSVPSAAWAFRCLALVPLLRGLTHLDMYCAQREMKFVRAALPEVLSNALMVLAAWPLGYWLRSYSAVLWLGVGQAASRSVISHLVARRPYGWHWDRRYASRILSFGWPLVINSLLMFAIFQGDRVVIGSADQIFHTHAYTLAALGIYSVAYSLTMVPTSAFMSVNNSLLLPVFSRLQNSRAEFLRKYSLYCQTMTLCAGSFALLFVLAGGRIITLAYGKPYQGAGAFVGWLAAMQGLRMMRVAPTQAAMARGDTKNAMVANIVRATALLGAFSVAAMAGPLIFIAICGFMGEVLALLVSVFRLNRMHSIPVQDSLRPVGIFAMAVLVAMLAAGLARHIGFGGLLAVVPVQIGVMAIGVFISAPAVWAWIRARWQGRVVLERAPAPPPA